MKSIISRLFALRHTKEKLRSAIRELDKYRLVLDQAPAAVYIIGKDMRFEYMNPHFTHQSGYTKEDLLNKHVNETIYKGKIPESRLHIVEALRRGESWQGELLSNHKNGSTYWANTIAAPYMNEHNEVEGFVIIQQDITEHKRMQIALDESERLYRTLIEKSLDGVVLSQNGKIIMVNKAFCDMLGCTQEEVLFYGPNELIAAEDRERIMEIHYQRMRGEIDSMCYNATLLHKSGRRIAAEFYSTNVQVNSANTSFITIRDITERENLHHALLESEQKFRHLVETTNSIILSWDRDFRITYLNDYGLKFFGFTRDELFNKSVIGTIIPRSEEVFNDRDLQALMGDIFTNPEKYAHNENENVCKNGDRVWISWNNTPVRNDKNEIVTIYSIGNDITQSKRMQLALDESEKLYRTLIEKSMDGVAITLNNRVSLANQAFCDMIGYTIGEVLMTEPALLIAPQDRESVVDLYTRRLKGEIVTSSYQCSMLHKNGSEIMVDVNASTVVLNGQNASFVTMRDITLKTAMEKALSESEQKYRTLIDKATDGILITQGGVFKFVNPAFCDMMQYTEKELINKPFIDVVDKAHHAEMMENHSRRMRGESFPAIYRARLFRKDGSNFMVELNSRTTDFEGTPASFVITRDITDRLQNEEELRKTQKELENLNKNLEIRVHESSLKLTEANTQLIRLQKENLQSQYEVLRQQVNPHFLFNSLNVLTSLIKLEPDLAEKFTEHLSKVYRYVLEFKDKDLVELNTELDFLDAYMFLLNMRFMEKVKMEVNISLDSRLYLILPLALQLIIENAIKHNTMSKKMPLHIRIFNDDQQMLNVTNNLQERESHMVSTGVGLRNISHRYELLEMPKPEFYKTETHFVARIPLKKKD